MSHANEVIYAGNKKRTAAANFRKRRVNERVAIEMQISRKETETHR